MIRTKICPKCGSLSEWDSYFGGTRCTRCDFVEKPKPTNYDRIISKTPEKLAEWISFITNHEDYRDVQPEGWLQWLESEAR